MNGYIFIAMTILLTVYGQLVTKWQLGTCELPSGVINKVSFLLRKCFNPWVFSTFAAAFFAALCWMAAMTILPISVAYPFTSLAFVLVMLGSKFFFDESLSRNKIAGTVLLGISLIFICL